MAKRKGRGKPRTTQELIDSQFPHAHNRNRDPYYEDMDFWGGLGNNSMAQFNAPKCAHSHPEFKIPVDGKEYTVVGGSATDPHRYDFDVWVALDGYADIPHSFKPYNNKLGFHYVIRDMSVPADPEDFKKFINYLAEQVLKGKSLFVGCIGGHGRTGLVLSALYYVLTGDKNSSKIVREKYCSKAIETKEQSDWLGEHFGILPVKTHDFMVGGGNHKKSNAQKRVDALVDTHSGASRKKSLTAGRKRTFSPERVITGLFI